MSTFLTGKELEDTVYDIIWDAKDTLMIVSPFIKLDDYFKTLFDNHLNNHKLHILIVFGKNEKMVKKSLSKQDFDYFKKFLNVSIVYVPKLHAKYYGNEKKGVITSINLYDYSFKNNIEFGVYSEQSILDRFTGSADNEAWNTCYDIVVESEAVFIKRPVYENKKMIVNLGKSYVKSDVLYDSTEKFYGLLKKKSTSKQTIKDFPSELELGSLQANRPLREDIENKNGYCIRTGVEIPFNPEQPMCKSAFNTWKRFGDANYPEKYCHKTGKKSNGKTSMANPILR